MPAAAAAATPAPSQFIFSHPGDPDVTDPAVVAAMSPDPDVLLLGADNMFVSATPHLQWRDAPAPIPTDPKIGHLTRQSLLDTLCDVGGVGTRYLRGVKDVMVLSVLPKRIGEFVSAWTAVGGMDLTVTYVTEAACFAAVSVAKKECGKDSRVSLSASTYFECQSRAGAPVSTASAALKKAWKKRDWMYCISGDMLLGDDDEDTFAFAMLRKGLSPRTVSASRDQSEHHYCRMLSAVHAVAAARSEYFKSNLESETIPVEEVAEYVTDTWRKLVQTGYPFKLDGRMPQRCMELDVATSLAFGSAAPKENAAGQLIADSVQSQKLLMSCIEEPAGIRNMATLLGNFQQVASIVVPGARWNAMGTPGAVELELSRISDVIESWGEGSAAEMISRIRSLHSQEKALLLTDSKGSGGGLIGSGDSGQSGVQGVSGVAATRHFDFISTKTEIRDCNNFMEALDVMLASKSKVWLFKAVKQLQKPSSIAELEGCSEHLDDWCRYWPMTVSLDDDGDIHDEVQGESFDEDGKQVGLMLAGSWDLVDWILVAQKMERWTDGVVPESGRHLGQYSTLVMVRDVIFKTMKMLHLARDGESGKDITTCTGFMNKIIKLQRRSRAVPAGTLARKNAAANVTSVLLQGLKEFGARWSKQWKKPLSYNGEPLTSFGDKSCFVLRKLDKLDKVADQIFDWRENMPALFEDGWGERDGKSALLQHREIRLTATPSDSHHFCLVLAVGYVSEFCMS